MDIKLRARLSAFSKVDAIKSTVSDIPTVRRSDIDSLFPGQNERVVTKGEIDSLFLERNKPSAVDKTTIDTLFNNEKDTIGVVSYKDIDSLFEKR